MFQDKARGEARELADMQQSTRDVERLVFQMASSVAQLKKQVDALGSSKDTVDHRHRLAEHNGKVQGLARQIKERLTALNEDKAAQSPAQVAKARKLMQDFAAILQDYKATQKVAAEREASSLPRAPPVTHQRAAAAAAAMAATSKDMDADIENQALLQQQQVEHARVMENAIAYNEALIDERDQGIAEIQRQIGEVNEMFQDLAVLINDQGEQLQTIDVQISSTAERVREGGQQLVAAERSQRSARNKCLMLWLVSGIIMAIILVVLFA